MSRPLEARAELLDILGREPTQLEVAALAGVTPGSVWRAYQRAGIDGRAGQRAATKRRHEKIRSMLILGHSIAVVAIHSGCSTGSVRQVRAAMSAKDTRTMRRRTWIRESLREVKGAEAVARVVRETPRQVRRDMEAMEILQEMDG